MKLTKALTALAAAAMIAAPLFAVSDEGWKFGLSVDMAEYPNYEQKSSTTPGDFQFSGITGAYHGLEGRVNLSANYTFATPLGQNWLVNDANVVLGGKLEITPVSLNACASATFTPVPFLVFSAGAQMGEGWDLGPFKNGMSIYNGSDYVNAAGKTAFYKAWAQGTFQFDLGAVVPGDWTHIQLMYSYQCYYESLLGLQAGQIWAWNCAGNRLVGLKEYQNLILAYQMPIPVLTRVGVVVESDKYYSDAASTNAAWKASMPEINVSPMCQLTLSQKDTLTVLFNFCFSRMYAQNADSTEDAGHYKNPESTYTTVGYLGYFKRVAISYSHNF